jgi:hypothetical protein
MNLINPKGASFKENHLMTTAWERRLFSDSVHCKITSTFQTNQNTYNMTCDSKINLYICINQFQVLTIDRLNEIKNMSRCYICLCIYKISFGLLIYNKSFT